MNRAMYTRKQQEAIERSIFAPHITRAGVHTMPRVTGLLNVRQHLEWSLQFYGYIIEDIDLKRIQLPPAYETEIRKLRIVTAAILRRDQRKREETKSRKDIYVEAEPK